MARLARRLVNGFDEMLNRILRDGSFARVMILYQFVIFFFNAYTQKRKFNPSWSRGSFRVASSLKFVFKEV